MELYEHEIAYHGRWVPRSTKLHPDCVQLWEQGCGIDPSIPLNPLVSTVVRTVFEELFKAFARAGTGSSNRVACAILLDTPPSIDAHEITDKGSLNQGAVLRHRAQLVEELYAGSPRVIVAGGELPLSTRGALPKAKNAVV